MIQDNQIELIEAAKETYTYSFGSITSSVKIHASETSVKSKISLTQKRPWMKQQLWLILVFKYPSFYLPLTLKVRARSID